MRKLAAEFAVDMTEWSGEEYRLRLMTKPLYRYEPSDSQVLDGALFAFTYTTDPELLVMIEARKTDDKFRWMYGFARMNVGKLAVSHRGREIWRAEALEYPYAYQQGVYTLFMDLPVAGIVKTSAK